LDKVFTLQYKLQPAAKAGLTTVAKLGIGVGVTVGVALLLGLFVIFLKRRKWKRGAPRLYNPISSPDIPDMTWLDPMQSALLAAKSKAKSYGIEIRIPAK
jgi:hypothetical protein